MLPVKLLNTWAVRALPFMLCAPLMSKGKTADVLLFETFPAVLTFPVVFLGKKTLCCLFFLTPHLPSTIMYKLFFSAAGSIQKHVL